MNTESPEKLFIQDQTEEMTPKIKITDLSEQLRNQAKHARNTLFSHDHEPTMTAEEAMKLRRSSRRMTSLDQKKKQQLDLLIKRDFIIGKAKLLEGDFVEKLKMPYNLSSLFINEKDFYTQTLSSNESKYYLNHLSNNLLIHNRTAPQAPR